MARQHAGDIQYRVTVDRGARFADSPHRVQTYGPYQKEATASAQIARQRTYYGDDVTGVVEVGQVMWRPVGQEDDVNWEGYGDALSGRSVDE